MSSLVRLLALASTTALTFAQEAPCSIQTVFAGLSAIKCEPHNYP